MNEYERANGNTEQTQENQQSVIMSHEKSTNRNILDSSIPISLVSLSGEGIAPKLSVFGNDLRNSNPTKMGKMHTFLFHRQEPLIVVGPHCILT